MRSPGKLLLSLNKKYPSFTFSSKVSASSLEMSLYTNLCMSKIKVDYNEKSNMLKGNIQKMDKNDKRIKHSAYMFDGWTDGQMD